MIMDGGRSYDGSVGPWLGRGHDGVVPQLQAPLSLLEELDYNGRLKDAKVVASLITTKLRPTRCMDGRVISSWATFCRTVTRSLFQMFR